MPLPGHPGIVRPEPAFLSFQLDHTLGAGQSLYGHLNPHGKYRFDLDEDFHGATLKPLRSAGPGAISQLHGVGLWRGRLWLGSQDRNETGRLLARVAPSFQISFVIRSSSDRFFYASHLISRMSETGVPRPYFPVQNSLFRRVWGAPACRAAKAYRRLRGFPVSVGSTRYRQTMYQPGWS